MNYSCDLPINFSIEAEALDLLSNFFPGCCLLLVMGFLGVINNLLLLLIAYRLNWLFQPQYTLIIGQTVTDTFLSLLTILEGARPIVLYAKSAPFVATQLQCVAWYVPLDTALNASQHVSMMIGIDRLYSALSPHRWVAASRAYRLVMLIVAWLWGAIEEAVWFAFVQPNVCVKLCTTEAYPSSWWSHVVNVSDLAASLIIVLSYVALPCLSGGFIRRFSCISSHSLVVMDRVEERQREIVQRVRRLSILTVVSYLCTTFLGILWFDVFETYSGVSFTQTQTVYMAPFLSALCSANAVVPLYMFLWRDPSVREQTRQIVLSWWRRWRSTDSLTTESKIGSTSEKNLGTANRTI